MNSIVMREWLTSFYAHVNSRYVLLLMDNFSAHISGVELAPPPPNIKIQWLPANSTSKFQPLDQGIIQNLKTHFKKQWLRFILASLTEERDPYKTVTLLNTLRWIAQAWTYDVQNTTIYACFQKSTVTQHPEQRSLSTLPTTAPAEVSMLYNQLRSSGQIRDMMSLNNFLNPSDETPAEEEEEDALQQALSRHIIV